MAARNILSALTETAASLARKRWVWLIAAVALNLAALLAVRAEALRTGAAAANPAVPLAETIVDPSPPPDVWMKEVGDIDGDGQIDLIVCGRNALLVWYQYPDWTRRTIAVEIGAPGSTTGVDAADIDLDGDIDVALANGRWFENPGAADALAGREWRMHSIDEGRGHDIFMVDLDGDGDIDAVTRDQGPDGGAVRVFRRDGADAWTPAAFEVPIGEGLGVADLDGDGDLDIAISGAWYENSGDVVGAWTQHVYAAAYREQDVVVAIGDINDDGRLDIVLSPAELAGGSSSVAWFEAPQDRTARFAMHVIRERQESVAHALQLGDFDLDGALDVAIAEMHQGRDPDEVVVFMNRDGGRSWQPHVISTGGSHSLRAADIDGDGDLDLFGANWNSEQAPDRGVVKLWRNNLNPPGAQAWRRHVIDNARPAQAVFVLGGDIDGDGRNDVAAGGFWYRNPGATERPWARRAFGGDLRNIAVLADLNGDGSLDALGTAGRGADPNATFSFAANDGAGRFSVRDGVAVGDGDFLQGAALARFGGGPLQVALSWHQAGRGVQMLTVPGAPSRDSWTLQLISEASPDEQLSAGDIDRDGRIDLLTGTRWLRNTQGGWIAHTLFETDDKPDRNRLADINRDGRLDAVVGYEAISERGLAAWYEQPPDAAGAWTAHRIGLLIGPMSLDVADIDSDGDVDVVVGEHNLDDPARAGLYVFENPGGGLGAWARRSVHVGDEHHDGAQLIDIDGDGDLDIISTGWGESKVVWYERLGGRP